jgi:c(7)-type cytochrome triheme protein
LFSPTRTNRNQKGKPYLAKAYFAILCDPLRESFCFFIRPEKNTRRHIFIVSMLVMAGVLPAAQDKPSSWGDPVAQWAKIKFSHKQHVEEVGAECSACHTAAQTSEKAGDLLFPKHAECGTCHAEVESENTEDCKFCHVNVDSLEAFAAPARDDIVFSHKQHLEVQKLECSACHAGIEKSVQPTVAFLPSMASCYSCHNDVKATNACESCHPRVETMLPLSHRLPDWPKEHKRIVHTETASSDCAACHTDNFCQTCHAEPSLQLTSGAPIRNVSENRPEPSGKNPLVKQSVHELNYLFLHSLDLRAKQSDCYSCHNQQTFCAECHARNQESGFPAPFPLSHRAPDFVRLGPGGGGQHAVLARRDMESCAACHDVEGKDPVCVICHTDLAPGGE